MLQTGAVYLIKEVSDYLFLDSLLKEDSGLDGIKEICRIFVIKSKLMLFFEKEESI